MNIDIYAYALGKHSAGFEMHTLHIGIMGSPRRISQREMIQYRVTDIRHLHIRHRRYYVKRKKENENPSSIVLECQTRLQNAIIE